MRPESEYPGMHIQDGTDTADELPTHYPGLRIMPTRSGRTSTVVLVLHGGRPHSSEPVSEHQLAYRRMVPIARALHRATADSGTAVWLLRNRVRGWNAPALDAIADARWALREANRRHPLAQVVLVGHSLGGRVALRLAGERSVAAVCALAPWIEPGEPVEQLAGKPVLIVHGDRDRVTSPEASERYATRAQEMAMRLLGGPGNSDALHPVHVEIPGSGHAMLRRRRVWDTVTRSFVRNITSEEQL